MMQIIFSDILHFLSSRDFLVGMVILVIMACLGISGEKRSKKLAKKESERIRLGRNYPLSSVREALISQKLEEIITKEECTLPHKTNLEDDSLNNDFLEILHDMFDFMQKDPSKGIKYAQGWHLKEETIRDFLPKLAMRYQGRPLEKQQADFVTYENWIEWKNDKEHSIYKLKP